MFRKTDPQTSLLESQFLLPPSKRARLEKSWSQVFNVHVLPLIDEELFRAAYHEDTGRPNKSVRLLTGLHLLKEWNDLTDEEVLESLEYNLQWHHALGVTSEDAHTCQKTLHNYRAKLMQDGRAGSLFDNIAVGLAALDGLRWGRQRLDSTHVMSNIAVLTRLGLFTETVTKFLGELRHEEPEKLGSLDGGYRERYLDREGYFADAKKKQARRRLPVVARDLLALVRAFEQDETIREWESYSLMVRLLDEQCEIIEPDDDSDSSSGPRVELRPQAEVSEGSKPAAGDGEGSGSKSVGDDESGDGDDAAKADGDDEAERPAELDAEGPGAEPATFEDPGLRLKEGTELSGGSLQSPHDPDATYGHKGKGYEVQIAETCEASNPYQIITGIDVNGANESDQHATLPMVEQLLDKGLGPEVMFADTAYGSGENIVACAECGVDLQAPVQDPNKPSAVDRWAEPVEPICDTSAETTAEGEQPQGDVPVSSATHSEPAPTNAMGLESFRFNAAYCNVETCPAGHGPREQEIRDAPVPYRAVFAAELCEGCPMASCCPTRRLKSGDRVLRWRDVKAATATRQRQQREPAFKEDYKIRSGVESTAGEYKGRHGAKKMRVRGSPRVEMLASLKAAALNTKRMVQYHTRQFAKAVEPTLALAGAMQ